MILRMVAGKKSTTQDNSGKHRGGSIAEIQVVAGTMMEDMTETRTKVADHLALATVVGMMTRMMLVDTTHMNPTPTIIYHQETEEEELEEETAIVGVGNVVVGGAEEEGVEEKEVEEEEGLMLFKEAEAEAEAVTVIASRVLSRSI